MSELPHDVRAKILIAEDDAIVALDLQGMVMRLGYDVVAIADTGLAAVAAARRFRPDIILLDMVLKGSMDGIDVAREIHTTFDVPIVFCVSSPDLSSLVRAKEISYAGYLLKPINPDSLSTTLDTVLYKYKLEKRVQKAEEKFQKLAERCEILQFLSENNAAFSWTWEQGSGVRFKSDADHPPVPSLISGLSARLDAAVADWASAGSEAHHFSFLLDSVVAIGFRHEHTGTISGMLIPLSEKTAGCPLK